MPPPHDPRLRAKAAPVGAFGRVLTLRFVLAVVVSAASLAVADVGGDVPIPGEQVAVVAEAHVSLPDGGSEPWRYLVFVPAGEAPEAGWPVLFYLHGRSARGSDFDRVRRYGPPSFVEEREEFPFLAIAPQLPAGGWSPASLDRLLDEILGTHPADRDRVCLTGVSLGAMGAWSWAAASPRRFAALAPICAHGPVSAAARVGELPIWAFHGDADEIVPIGPHRELAEAIEEAGGTIRFTVIEGGTHGSVIVPTYQRRELFDWMLRRNRRNRLADE